MGPPVTLQVFSLCGCLSRRRWFLHALFFSSRLKKIFTIRQGLKSRQGTQLASWPFPTLGLSFLKKTSLKFFKSDCRGCVWVIGSSPFLLDLFFFKNDSPKVGKEKGKTQSPKHSHGSHF